MKKIKIGILICLLALAAFAGCGETSSKPTETSQTQKAQNDSEEKPQDTSKEDQSSSSDESSVIRQELKDFLASYEACVDEYVEFMQNYNPTDLSMLSKYTDIMQKYTDFAQKATEWEGKDLNNEELLYYTEVLSRVSEKLLKGI